MNWLTTAIREALTAYDRFATPGTKKRSGVANPSQWLIDWANGGAAGASGVAVNETIALTMSAVWRAVWLLATTEATLPIKVVESKGDEEIIRRDVPAYRLLKRRANPTLNALQFRMLLTQNVVLWGNGYAEIEFDRAGRPMNLWPMLPKYVQVKVASDGSLWYEYQPPGQSKITLSAEKVLHIKGMGGDGVTGWSVIRNARESLGNALAADRFAGHYFGQGMNVGAVLEHPSTLGEEAHKRLRESNNDLMSGLDNSHRLAILEEGMKLSRNNMPLDDAQMLETRHFGIEDVSRWFGVPQHMLSELGRATWGNVESLAIEFVTYGLIPWLAIWEAECNEKLFGAASKDKLGVKHIVEGLLRGDSAARSALYASGIQWGWMKRNEVRRLEDLPPMKGGDVALIPANMVDADTLGEEPEDEPPPAVPPVPPAPDEDDDEDDRSTALRIAEAHRGIWCDAAGRMLRKESQAARRAAKKPAKFLAWIDEWYDDHAHTFRAAIGPAADATALATGLTLEDAADHAKELTRSHCLRSRTGLATTARMAEPPDLAQRIHNLTSGWESGRADEFATEATGADDA